MWLNIKIEGHCPVIMLFLSELRISSKKNHICVLNIIKLNKVLKLTKFHKINGKTIVHKYYKIK